MASSTADNIATIIAMPLLYLAAPGLVMASFGLAFGMQLLSMLDECASAPEKSKWVERVAPPAPVVIKKPQPVARRPD